MVMKVYGDLRSPCVRSVLLAIKALNLDVEFVTIDIIKHENLSPEYLKINPRHSVPVLDDNGFLVWDSHAIMMYLVEKYGNDNPLYPKDIQKRARINQMLHFETGDIFGIHIYIARLIIATGSFEIPEDPKQALEKGYGFLETFLKDSKFITGDVMTIADFSIWTTISNCRFFVPIDETIYPSITAWVARMQSLPYSNLNEEGVQELELLIKSMKQK